MYTLIENIALAWSCVYPAGSVKPFFSYDDRGYIRLHFCELYDAQGKCKGVWSKMTMHPTSYKAIANYINACDRSRIVQEDRDWSYITY